MKKRWWLSLGMVLALTACQNFTPFALDDEFYGETGAGLETLTSFTPIAQGEEEGKSMAVYVFLAGCVSCAIFQPILETYLSEHHLRFYAISIRIANQSDNSISQVVEVTPAIVLYREGKRVTFLDATKESHKEAFQSATGLHEWLTNYILLEPLSE